MAKRGILLLAVWLLVMFAGGCDSEEMSYPAATDRFFVNDYADIMSETDEQAVYEAGVKLYEATDAQVVLLTVNDTGDDTLEDYALAVARTWKLGDNEKDNGLLLLFTVDGPHSRIEIGYGLEGAISDSKAGRILDTYLVPWYDDDTAWSTQLTDTYRVLVNEVYAEYGMTESQLPLNNPVDDSDIDDTGDIIMLIPMLLVLILILSTKHRGIFFLPHFGGFYGGSGGGFRSGGGFSGGGFSGGGGGFGGGGASR